MILAISSDINWSILLNILHVLSYIKYFIEKRRGPYACSVLDAHAIIWLFRSIEYSSFHGKKKIVNKFHRI